MKRIIEALLSVAEYLFLMLSALVCVLMFFVLQRAKVYNKRRMVYRTNLVIASNHQTFIDSFLVGTALYFPYMLLHPKVVPWHLAASENFFKTWGYRLAGRFWRAIPVKPGRKDPELLRRLKRELGAKVIHVFPEGGRSRTGAIGNGHPSVGLWIHHCRPVVVPVRIIGMDRVQPVGHRMLRGQIFAVKRLFQNIAVVVGQPVELSDLYSHSPSTETARLITERIMEAIRSLEPLQY